MVKAQMAISTLTTAIAKFIWTDDFLFPASMWLVSRIFIWIAMLLIAPNLPALQDGITPHFGWGIFDAWDSVHYRAISTEGYEFVDDGKIDLVLSLEKRKQSIEAEFFVGIDF